ncbi:MAG: hypothetical protein V3V01_00710 [Acidimicrobiales bacterium]
MKQNHSIADSATQVETDQRRRPRRVRWALVVGVLALIAASCSSGGADSLVEAIGEQPAIADIAITQPPTTPATTNPAVGGTVAIEATPDFTGDVVVGTFVVSEGDEILGCSAGSFEDAGSPLGIDRILTCNSGARSGTINIRFNPVEAPGPGDLNGPWEVRSATGGFSGLGGGGDFSVTFSDDDSAGTESLIGEIAYGNPTISTAVAAHTVDRLNRPGAKCFDGFGTTDGLEEYATVDNSMLRLTIATGEITDHGPPPVECALWLGNEQAGRRIATSPDSKTIWFGPFEGPWQIEKALEEPLFLMSRSFGANRLVFVSDDGRSAVLLDATTGEQIGDPLEARFADGRSFSATAVSTDETLVAVGAANPDESGNDGRVFVVDSASGAIVHQLDLKEAVTAMVFSRSHDGSTEQLVVAGVEGMVTTIEVASGKIVAEVRTSNPGDAVLAIGTRPDGLLVVGSERSAELIDRTSGPTGNSIDLTDRGTGRVRADGAVVTIRDGYTYEIFDDLVKS